MVRHRKSSSSKSFGDAETTTLSAWQRSFEIRVSAASNEGIGEPGAGGEDFNADLARARFGDARLFGQFEDLRAAEPSDANMLPRHDFTPIDIIPAQPSLSMLRRGQPLGYSIVAGLIVRGSLPCPPSR
jgi:hypothetical protein